ncbi:MAG TPA: hypothetical protein EYH11_06125 [Sulfurimonas autotrophica]|nr:hypothetical protein [Sulfurimonas autotrophica]
MILKIVIVGAVIAAIYFLFFKTKPEIKVTKKESKKSDADEMVECTTCGVYAEVQESILSNGKYYCCRECLMKEK